MREFRLAILESIKDIEKGVKVTFGPRKYDQFDTHWTLCNLLAKNLSNSTAKDLQESRGLGDVEQVNKAIYVCYGVANEIVQIIRFVSDLEGNEPLLEEIEKGMVDRIREAWFESTDNVKEWYLSFLYTMLEYSPDSWYHMKF